MARWDTETLAQKLKENPDFARANIKTIAGNSPAVSKKAGLASGKGKTIR